MLKEAQDPPSLSCRFSIVAIPAKTRSRLKMRIKPVGTASILFGGGSRAGTCSRANSMVNSLDRVRPRAVYFPGALGRSHHVYGGRQERQALHQGNSNHAGRCPSVLGFRNVRS